MFIKLTYTQGEKFLSEEAFKAKQEAGEPTSNAASPEPAAAEGEEPPPPPPVKEILVCTNVRVSTLLHHIKNVTQNSQDAVIDFAKEGVAAKLSENLESTASELLTERQTYELVSPLTMVAAAPVKGKKK